MYGVYCLVNSFVTVQGSRCKSLKAWDPIFGDFQYLIKKVISYLNSFPLKKCLLKV